MITDASVQGFQQAVCRGLQSVFRDREQLLRVALSRDDGFQNRPPAYPENIADQTGDLEVGILERLLDTQRVLADLAGKLLARPRQVSQFLDRRVWNEARPNETVGQ